MSCINRVSIINIINQYWFELTRSSKLKSVNLINTTQFNTIIKHDFFLISRINFQIKIFNVHLPHFFQSLPWYWTLIKKKCPDFMELLKLNADLSKHYEQNSESKFITFFPRFYLDTRKSPLALSCMTIGL